VSSRLIEAERLDELSEAHVAAAEEKLRLQTNALSASVKEGLTDFRRRYTTLREDLTRLGVLSRFRDRRLSTRCAKLLDAANRLFVLAGGSLSSVITGESDDDMDVEVDDDLLPVEADAEYFDDDLDIDLMADNMRQELAKSKPKRKTKKRIPSGRKWKIGKRGNRNG